MNQRSKEKKSNLHVSLMHAPETSHVRLDHDFYDDQSFVKCDLIELAMEDGFVTNHFYYGEDATLRMSLCILDSETQLYSIPEEPVVIFRIQRENEHYAKFEKSGKRTLWGESQIRLGWQSNETIVYELPDGPATHFDLFIRPDLFLEMANRYPILRELAMEIKTAKGGNLDLLVTTCNERIDIFATEMLDELQCYEVSTRRFQHLCECLLLLTKGIILPVEPIDVDAVKKEDNLDWSEFDSLLFAADDEDDDEDDTDDMFTPYQYYLIDTLREYNQEELISQFYSGRHDFNILKNDYLKNKKLIKKLKYRYLEIMEDSGELLADAYFKMALCLDAQTEKFKLDDRETKIIEEAVISVSEQSFELRIPGPEHAILYSKWSKKPYFPRTEIEDFESLMEIIGPQFNIDVSDWGDAKESTAVFCEHLQDQLGGFKSFTQFMGQQEEDKPKELVELYHRLMQNLSDELTITDEGEIKKSDIIRILDHAYDISDPIQLLLIEIEYFSHDENYVNMQDVDKLRSWIVALADRSKELHEQVAMLEKDPLFSLIEIYEEAPDKMKAVERHAHSTREAYQNILESLPVIVKGIEDRTTKELVLGIAKSMIIAK